MTKEKLALDDFSKSPSVVLACGIENAEKQEQSSDCLPLCRTHVKVTAKTIKLVKPRKVSAK